MIPSVVDALTPDGTVPDERSLLSRVGGFLSEWGGAVGGAVAGGVGAASAMASGTADRVGGAVSDTSDRLAAGAGSVGNKVAGTVGRAGDSLPVVQCARVQREGPLTGAGAELLSLSDPIPGEADCP